MGIFCWTRGIGGYAVIIRVSPIRAHTRAKAIGFQAYLMQTGVAGSQALGYLDNRLLRRGS